MLKIHLWNLKILFTFYQKNFCPFLFLFRAVRFQTYCTNNFFLVSKISINNRPKRDFFQFALFWKHISNPVIQHHHRTGGIIQVGTYI